MKTLGQTLEKILIGSRKEETKPVPEGKVLYRGFRLVEDRDYQGPTSIKYWM